MGTWVRVSGKIDVDISCLYHRNELSPYRYEDYKRVQSVIKKWIERAYRKHLFKGLGLDCYCGMTFDEQSAYHSNYEYLYDCTGQNRYDITRYDGLTIYLNVWDRNGLLSDGEKFVGTVLQILKSNQCFVRDTTMINVTADYAPEQLIVYTGNKSVELTVKQWGYDGQ